MRVYTQDNVPKDFCAACVPTEEEALAKYGPDVGWYAYDAEHPTYGAGYNCCLLYTSPSPRD